MGKLASQPFRKNKRGLSPNTLYRPLTEKAWGTRRERRTVRWVRSHSAGHTAHDSIALANGMVLPRVNRVMRTQRVEYCVARHTFAAAHQILCEQRSLPRLGMVGARHVCTHGIAPHLNHRRAASLPPKGSMCPRCARQQKKQCPQHLKGRRVAVNPLPPNMPRILRSRSHRLR